MPHNIEDVREYWNSHLNLTQFLTEGETEPGSEEFYRQLEESMHRFEYKLHVLERFAEGRKGQHLLEIGCGLGVELGLLGKLGFRVTGIDLAPKAVELCNGNLRRLGVEGEARVANAETLEFADGSFDAVYSSGVLQHTPSIENAIAEIWRVLKPGGNILIILYHTYSWFYLLHKLSGIHVEFQSEDAPIINTYSRGDLRRLFSRFDDIRIDTEYYYPQRTRRTGAIPALYNRVFVPGTRLVPRPVMKRFGWHLVMTARKPSAP